MESDTKAKPIITRAQAIERGLTRYFTGLPCKKGHLSERTVVGWVCLACRAERMARYQRTEKFKSASRKYQRPPKYKAARGRYRDTEGYKAIARGYDRARSEKHNAAKREYRKTEAGRAATRKYNQTPKHRVALFLDNRKRRAIKHNAIGTFTAKDERRLREQQKKCHICGKRFTKVDPVTLDHVIPLAKGGPHDASNIALAHESCNRNKRDRRTHLI